MNIAARATWAPGPGSRQGIACSPWLLPIRISSCQELSNSTSSMRWPKRSWVFSSGLRSLASKPQRIVCAEPQIAPSSRARSSAHSAPSRRSASCKGRSASKGL